MGSLWEQLTGHSEMAAGYGGGEELGSATVIYIHSHVGISTWRKMGSQVALGFSW